MFHPRYPTKGPQALQRVLCQVRIPDVTTNLFHQQVRKYVIRREVQPKGEGKSAYTKAPKIQRLVTPQRLQHKRHRAALKRRQAEKVKDEAVSLFSHACPFSLWNPLTHVQNEYAQVLAKRVAEAKADKADARKRRASSMRK